MSTSRTRGSSRSSPASSTQKKSKKRRVETTASLGEKEARADRLLETLERAVSLLPQLHGTIDEQPPTLQPETPQGTPLNTTPHIEVSDQQVANDFERFQSSGLELDALVPQKTKESIWAGKFVDLAILLRKPESTYSFSLIPTPGHETPGLSIAPTKAAAIKSIEQWVRAFEIFCTVHLRTRPGDAIPLIKYGRSVQNLAAQDGDWAFYDNNFRAARASSVGVGKWDVVNWELWMEARNRVSSAKPFRAGKFPGSRGLVCYAFNSYSSCKRKTCSFPHVCRNCRGDHSVTKCTKSATNVSYQRSQPKSTISKPPTHAGKN